MTTSNSFPVTAGAFQTSRGSTFGADFDAYVCKLNSTGTALVYSTYLGGFEDELLDSGDIRTGDIVVDASGNAYVTGYTESDDFPSASNTRAGEKDVFVVKFNPQGTDVDFSRYLGGSEDEEGNGITIDSDGNIIVVGYTDSDDFPVANAFQSSNASSGEIQPQDMFITKLDNSGNIIFSTYLGGSENVDEASAVAVDAQNNIYVTGIGAPDFPRIDPSTEIDQDKRGTVVVKLDAAGSPIYSTAITGSSRPATDIALSNNDQVIVVGNVRKDVLLVKNAFQDTSGDIFAADGDAFVLKLESGVDLRIIVSAMNTSLALDDSLTLSIQVQNTSSNDASNVVVSNILPAGFTFNSASVQCSHSAGTVTCTVGNLAAGDSIILEVVAQATTVGSLSNTANVSSTEADTNLVDNQQMLAITVSDSASGSGSSSSGNGSSSSGDDGGGDGGGGSAISLLFLLMMILVQGYKRYHSRIK